MLILSPLSALQVEWSKAYARARRFSEEEALVLEEMKRVRRYFAWKASWWREKVTDAGLDKVVHGKNAYALKQASMWVRLESKFFTLWQNELSNLKLDLTLLNV